MQANRRIVMVQGKCHDHPSCDSNGGSGDEVADDHCQGHGQPACDRDGGSSGGIDDIIGCDCDVNGSVMLMIVEYWYRWYWWRICWWCDGSSGVMWCDDDASNVGNLLS